MAEVLFYCAGALLIFENQRWLVMATQDKDTMRDPDTMTFFEAAYLSVITLTCIG